MNEQSQTNSKLKQNPCHICGSQKFTWGSSITYTNSIAFQTSLYFCADQNSWGKGEKLRARKCSKCKNVQLFADYAEEKAARKAAFEKSSGIVV